MRRAVLWDSSAVLALVDAADAHHRRAAELARAQAAERAVAFVTNYVEAETHALLLRKVGRLAARTWLLARAVPIVRATEDDEEAARALIARHDDKDWSFCDAVSVVMMSRLGVRRAFSFDRHFVQYGRVTVLGAERG